MNEGLGIQRSLDCRVRTELEPYPLWTARLMVPQDDRNGTRGTLRQPVEGRTHETWGRGRVPPMDSLPPRRPWRRKGGRQTIFVRDVPWLTAGIQKAMPALQELPLDLFCSLPSTIGDQPDKKKRLPRNNKRDPPQHIPPAGAPPSCQRSKSNRITTVIRGKTQGIQ